MKKKKCLIDGMKFESQSAAAKHFGVSRQAISHRLANGSNSTVRKIRKKFLYDGCYLSQSDVAKRVGVTSATIANNSWYNESVGAYIIDPLWGQLNIGDGYVKVCLIGV